ncbi:MAG: hypothetical protein U5J63_03400 [Fodinibius sp.]|nr:hypothetical protein [Fodinibius sp.]
MVQPAQANRSSQAFAHWLSTMTKSTNMVSLQKELNTLRDAGHLGKTIEEASQIVSRNNEEFEFSFAETMASQHLYDLLLIEWSQFQTENAMASVPVQPPAKGMISSSVDKMSTSGILASKIKAFDLPGFLTQFLSNQQPMLASALEPMVDSIAIGAP